MPHYTDGTEARTGDIVRGKGYNIKDEHGDLAEITGILLSVTPGSTACNISLLVPDKDLEEPMRLYGSVGHRGVTGAFISGQIEYGQADHFEKVG